MIIMPYDWLENGHVEVVSSLKGCQPGQPPVAKVKLLLEHPGVDPTDNDNEAIRFASSNGYVDVVKLLQEYGASLR